MTGTRTPPLAEEALGFPPQGERAFGAAPLTRQIVETFERRLDHDDARE